MYHTYMHTYITFLRIGTSDHSRKLSNTADWVCTRFETIDCGNCPAVLLFSIALPLTTTCIHTYVHTCMLVCLFVRWDDSFPNVSDEHGTWLPDGNTWWTCVHVGGHLRAFPPSLCRMHTKSWSEKEADETGRLLEWCDAAHLYWASHFALAWLVPYDM